MAFQRGHNKDLHPLLPEAGGDKLQEKGLSRAAHPHEDHSGIGVFGTVENVQHTDRAVMEVDAQHNTALVADLEGGKGKGRCHAGR